MTVIGRRSYSIITQLSLYLLYMNMLIAQKGDIFNWWNVGVYKVEYPPPWGGQYQVGWGRKSSGEEGKEKGKWKGREDKKGKRKGMEKGREKESMRKGNKGKAREK